MTRRYSGGVDRTALEAMVAEADTGGRKPTGISKTLVLSPSRWSLCSSSGMPRPCPIIFSFGVFNDGRSAHHPSVLRSSSGLHRLSRRCVHRRGDTFRSMIGRCRSPAVLAAALSAGVTIRRISAAAGLADDRRHHRLGDRRRAARRSIAARRRPVRSPVIAGVMLSLYLPRPWLPGCWPTRAPRSAAPPRNSG